jgi:D-tyrosyl-tRNA(Tyr) deacylase
MRAVVQRVKEARVEVEGQVVGEIAKGLLVLLGVGAQDTESDGEYLAGKIANLRIFPDEKGLMNLSVLDTGGAVLVVSQFTLWGDCRKGRRPSFAHAAPPDKAVKLYEAFMENVKTLGLRVASGRFQEMMDVHLINDGPVTLMLDSTKAF